MLQILFVNRLLHRDHLLGILYLYIQVRRFVGSAYLVALTINVAFQDPATAAHVAVPVIHVAVLVAQVVLPAIQTVLYTNHFIHVAQGPVDVGQTADVGHVYRFLVDLVRLATAGLQKTILRLYL